jgi:hypothetical protein
MKYYIHESITHVYLVSGTLWATNMRVVKLYADGTSSNDDICAIEFEQDYEDKVIKPAKLGALLAFINEEVINQGWRYRQSLRDPEMQFLREREQELAVKKARKEAGHE